MGTLAELRAAYRAAYAELRATYAEHTADMVARYEAGASVADLAVLAGIHKATAYAQLKRTGCKMRPKGHIKGCVPSTKRERNAQIVARVVAGESQADIARDLGISRERVRQIVARAGLEPHRAASSAQKAKRAAKEQERAAVRASKAAVRALNKDARKKKAAEVKFMREAGLPWRVIADRFGVSPMAVLKMAFDHFPETRERPYVPRG